MAKRYLTICSESETLGLVKPAFFHPKARASLREFSDEVREKIGVAIFELQKGEKLSMPLSRPMPSIMAGVEELRIKDGSGAYRVFYFSRSPRGILIFHAFVKKTQKTPQREIELGLKRLKEMLDEKE